MRWNKRGMAPALGVAVLLLGLGLPGTAGDLLPAVAAPMLPVLVGLGPRVRGLSMIAVRALVAGVVVGGWLAVRAARALLLGEVGLGVLLLGLSALAVGVAAVGTVVAPPPRRRRRKPRRPVKDQVAAEDAPTAPRRRPRAPAADPTSEPTQVMRRDALSPRAASGSARPGAGRERWPRGRRAARSTTP